MAKNKNTRSDRFVLIDIESNQIAVNNESQMYEIGFTLVDANLEVVDAISYVIHNPSPLIADDFVLNMHTKSGLLDEVRDPLRSLDIDDVEGDLIHILSDMWEMDGSDAMTGSSLADFDRPWLRHFFPVVNDLFHYRNTDVSTLKELCSKFNPELFAEYKRRMEGRVAAHRVLGDMAASLFELKFYRDHFLVTAG